MSKILTLVPTRGIIFTKHQDALESELATIDQYPKILRTTDIPLPDSRNLLIDTALKFSDWRFLLLLDDDVVMPEGSLQAMLDTLTNGSGNDIAVIDYPHHLAEQSKGKLGVATYEQWKEGESVVGKKLAWAGLGCVLMKRKAVEAMPKPMFVTSSYQYVRGEDGKLRMDAETKKNTVTASSGEDVYFYFEARKLGLKVAVVPHMVAGHCRIEQFVYRLAGGRYRTTHKIATNNIIDRPEI